MGFYTSASFFILLGIAIIPAAVLGFTGHSIKKYGFCATLVFLLCLFAGDVSGLLAFLFFLAVSGGATAITLRSWKSEEKSLLKYRLCLAATLMPLVVYKVCCVFDQNILGFIGISYVTFKSIQVIVEIRDGLIKDMKPFDWLYFVCFFPVITSGPIDRSRRFMEDADKVYERKEYADLLSRGILLLLCGAVYQLVFATILQGMFSFGPYNPSRDILANLLHAGKEAWLYGFYLFFDFAGYSLMAMGASYCFGIRTPRNFKAPFASIDIKDFWNRWHMTLSFWLRDFVFMRFTMFATKKKLFSDRLYTAMCGYLINMSLMGVWHGITVDYILYGIYHGLLLALTDAFQKRSKFYKKHKKDNWYKLLSWAVTINLVMFGFALFSGQVTTFVGGFF